MASRKRYIDADMFKDEWFIDLVPKYKLAWVYLLTNCGHDGLWKVSQKLLSFNVGDNVEIVGLKRALGDRVVELDGGNLWFIPKFIFFQYGTNLSRNNPALKQVFLTVDKFGLHNYLNLSITTTYEGGTKPLYKGAKVIVIDKDKDKDKEEGGNNSLTQVSKLFISTWARNPKNYSEVLGVEKLFLEYEEKHIVQAFRRAAEMDKTTVAYVKGILKKHYEKMAVNKERKDAAKKKLESLGINPEKSTIKIK